MTLNLKVSKSNRRGENVENCPSQPQLEAVIHAAAAKHAMPEINRTDAWYQQRRAELKQQLREILIRKQAA